MPLFDGMRWVADQALWIYIIGGVFMLLLAIVPRLGWRRAALSSSYGSARFATSTELQRGGLFAEQGVYLGIHGRHYVRDDSDGHILVVARTRAGKGVGVIVPTLLTWAESVLVTDPKDGENYDLTREYRETVLGHLVYAFTPMKAPTTRIDVMRSIRIETSLEYSDARFIASSLTAPVKMVRENSTSLHFRELATSLLTAIFLHVLYTEKEISCSRVLAFMTRHGSLVDTLKLMSRTKHLSEGVHQAIATLAQSIENITGDRELGSVWSTAFRPMELYLDPLIAASTDGNDVAFDALQYGDTPMSLYLIAASPFALEELHPIYRVITDAIMARLMEHKVRTWQHRLLGVFDEVCAFGYSRMIDKGIPVMAGYGIKSLLVSQDLEEWHDVYGEHNRIWGNCATRMFFGLANDLTAKRVSQNLLGDSTVEQAVHQRSYGGSRTGSTTMQYHGRPLLTAAELMELPDDQAVIIRQGMKPAIVTKIDYRTDGNLSWRVS